MLQKIKKGFYIGAGTLFVMTGVIGIFLPVLPTTVFLLLAAWCYARSSEKFYQGLLKNRYLGRFITHYREKKGISIKSKVFTLGFLWVTILLSAFVFLGNIYLKILLILIALGVSIHVLTIKTLRNSESGAAKKVA